jgi:hypothetical protein
MALITEHPYNGKNDRIKHYSDSGLMIEQVDTGNRYVEAVDRYPTPHTYVETDEPIPQPPEESEGDLYA